MIQTRRDFLRCGGIGAAALATGCSAEWFGPKPSEKVLPNIIYILADDLGYGDIGCYGQKKIRTLNIDRLAAEGMLFRQHYAGSTVCAPSRCSLMTGLHTGHCQIRGNREIKPEGQFPLAADTLTVAKVLKHAGYTTGAIGKWGLGYPGSSGEPLNEGFDYFYGYNCQREAHFYYPRHLWENREKVELPGNDTEKETGVYAPDLMTAKALDFVRRNSGKPFFLYFPITIPHAELAVPEDSLNQYKGGFPEKPFPGDDNYGAQQYPRAAYAAMVSRMDRYIGELMELLRELKLDKDTVVMFSSDNGPHREGGADPDFFDSSGPFRGCKRDLYEGGIRVPMIARWPGRIKAGSSTGQVSAFWDIMPTLAELVKQPVPENIDGISFLPVLLGEKSRQRQHEYLYWEFHEQGGRQAVRKGNWKAVRLNVSKEPAATELYNLAEDIGEKRNIADKHPEIVRELEQIMDKARTPNAEFKLLKNEIEG